MLTLLHQQPVTDTSAEIWLQNATVIRQLYQQESDENYFRSRYVLQKQKMNSIQMQ